MKLKRPVQRFAVVLVGMAAILLQGGVSLAAPPSADLKVTKSGPATATAGTDISYTITVKNLGPDTATAPTMKDTVPTNTTFVSVSATGWTCTHPAPGGTGTVTCDRNADMANGDTDTITLTVHVISSPTSCSIKNTASVSSTTSDPDATNNSDQATTTVSACADVSVTKTDTPDPVVAGTNLTYTITVKNTGPNAATGVSLTDTLPSDTTFVSLTCPAGWTCATPAVGTTGTVTATISSLPNSTTSTFTLVVKVSLTPSKCTITNTAKITTSTKDPDATNDADTAITNITGCADLSVAKTAFPSPVIAGTTLTYTITVTNHGPNTSLTPTLSDPLPASTTFISIACPAGWTCTPPPVGSSGTVIATTANLVNGASATFTLVVRVVPEALGGTVIANTAKVSAGTVALPSPDPVPSNNSATATAVVHRQADLSVTNIGRPHPVKRGHQSTYTITVANNGPSAAKNAKVRDFVGHHVVFQEVSAPGGWFCSHPAVGDTGRVRCTNQSFDAGDSDVIILVVRVKNHAPNGTLVKNTAHVSSPTPDPNHGNNASTATALVHGG